MNGLEGANCADLPGFVIDKYFDCNASSEPLKAMVARAICSHCVVLEACREQAFNMPLLPTRGILGGVSLAEIQRARSWRQYESGLRDTAPNRPRPSWLTRPEATETVEQTRVESDPDEPEIER